MADLQLSTGMRNAMMDGTPLQTIFNSGSLEIRNGTKPADPDDAPSGTVLATFALPADCFNPAAAGAITRLGTWQDASADAAGTATWFRIMESTDGGGSSSTDARIDGDVTATSGGGDLELDNIVIGAGQQVTINTFTLTMPAA